MSIVTKPAPGPLKVKEQRRLDYGNRGSVPVVAELALNGYPGRKPRLLDLFCCAGGAGVGYNRAGFEVVGVDNKPQPNYPLTFIQADALKLDLEFLLSFDAIHASPPCQSYSDLAKRNKNADDWPRLIEPVREMLMRTGLPYVIENVDGEPLNDPVVLWETMFPKVTVQ
jgi:DNA (cytosine-5)-methyltransferase 1